MSAGDPPLAFEVRLAVSDFESASSLEDSRLPRAVARALEEER